jgi:hypothetical protein
MIIINNKEIRNTVEQVHKNKDDIDDLQESTATKDYVDNSISGIYGDFYTREQADDRFPTETHMEYLLGGKQDKLTAGNNITIDSNNVISATGGSTPTNYVTTDSTQYVTASKIFKTAVGANIGATIYPASGSFYAETNGTSTSFAPQKISLSCSQSATPFNFQIHSSQGEGHNGTYTFDNSKTGIVAVTSDITNAGFITDTSGTYETWTFTLANNTTVTKNVKVK